MLSIVRSFMGGISTWEGSISEGALACEIGGQHSVRMIVQFCRDIDAIQINNGQAVSNSYMVNVKLHFL